MRTGFYIMVILAIAGLELEQGYAIDSTEASITVNFIQPMKLTALLLGVAAVAGLCSLAFARIEKVGLAIGLVAVFTAIFSEIVAVSIAAPFQPQMSGELLTFMRLEVALTVSILVAAGVRLIYLSTVVVEESPG